MSFRFPKDFEDRVTELVTNTFADLPTEIRQEPVHMTNDRLPKLADDLAGLARECGCLTHFSAPVIRDNWVDGVDGSKSSYEITVMWHGVAAKPSFEIPILPRDAA